MPGFHDALDMPAHSRLIIKKLKPDQNPEEIYRWVLARLDMTTSYMVVIDQFLDLPSALMEVDNIYHLEQEGRL